MKAIESSVVLITGASSGIGEATAIRLKNAGYIVFGAARRLDRMSKLKSMGINIISLDVTNEDSISSAVGNIIKLHDRIDILINNAGYGSYGALEDVPIDEAKRQFEVNVFGLTRLSQLVLPSMRKNRYGKIVNISSIGGKIYEPLGSWYHATKFAVEALSDCLRLEVQDFNIDVIIIEPGLIKSEWNQIARENMLKISGNTAYKDLAVSAAELFENSVKTSSEPDVIAKVIENAIKVKNLILVMLQDLEQNRYCSYANG